MIIVVKIIWALSLIDVLAELFDIRKGSGFSLAIGLFMLLASSVAVFFMVKFE